MLDYVNFSYICSSYKSRVVLTTWVLTVLGFCWLPWQSSRMVDHNFGVGSNQVYSILTFLEQVFLEHCVARRWRPNHNNMDLTGNTCRNINDHSSGTYRTIKSVVACFRKQEKFSISIKLSTHGFSVHQLNVYHMRWCELCVQKPCYSELWYGARLAWSYQYYEKMSISEAYLSVLIIQSLTVSFIIWISMFSV